MSVQTSTINSHAKHRLWISAHECAVCGSKAIGINFGAPTCAPCKAFFRRNARRREIFGVPCQIVNSNSLIIRNNDRYNDNCSQLRRCTSCRLRRCFDVGMKAELVRTDEEKERYKQLIETNRRRRREVLKVQEKSPNNLPIIPRVIVANNQLLEEKDWRILSNIVYAYDNYCLKLFTQNRKNIFNNQIKFSEQPVSKINHHIAIRVNNITSFLSFLSSIPIIQALSSSNRFYLCKHNIRSLILPNLHEIQQTCFTELSQINLDDAAAEYVYGKTIFADFVQVKNRAGSILINDPVVTRLWLLTLFFSTPLRCHYDRSLPEISQILHDNRLYMNRIQNSFTTLLWNYLSHRHGYFDTVRIFSNLLHVYLQMQRVSEAINHQLRTRNDLVEMNQALNRAVILESDLYLQKKRLML